MTNLKCISSKEYHSCGTIVMGPVLPKLDLIYMYHIITIAHNYIHNTFCGYSLLLKTHNQN